MGVADIKNFWNDLESRQRLWCGYALIAMLGLLLAWSALSARVSALEKKRLARESVLRELMPLKAAFQSAKATADQNASRMAGLRPDDSPGKIMEEIGIRGKGFKIAPVKGEERPGFVEDAAEIRVDGLTSNELVNLLYRIEKGNRPMLVKKATVRGRFDDPAKLDLTVTLALVKPAPGQTRP